MHKRPTEGKEVVKEVVKKRTSSDKRRTGSGLLIAMKRWLFGKPSTRSNTHLA